MTLPIILFPFSIFIVVLYESFQKQRLSKMSLFFFVILLALFSALRNPGLADYFSYELFYYGDYVGERFEPTAKIIRRISPTLIIFFLIYALISIGLKLYAIKENSDFQLFSLLTYISTSFALHDMVQIRVSCSIGIFWIALKYLRKREFFKYSILICLCCCFHISSAVLFILPFFSSQKIRKWFWIILVFLSYLLVFFHYDMLKIVTKLLPNDNYVYVTIMTHLNSDINIYNINQLLRIVVFIYLCLYNRQLNKDDIPLLKIFGLSIISLPLLSSMPVIAYRISEMLGTVIVFLLPKIINCSKKKQVGFLFFLVVCFMLCYLNNVHNKYGII